ncbi:MAG: flagellar basal-body rod protein FlgF [Rhizobiales bacterium]|nr:flagellar basal-body rod protein FlgF [Hyphomicrobiales bacterium]
MENLALIGLSRQIALSRELEVVSNNIANLNTTGYKADGSVFHEFLMPTARHGAFQGTDQRLSFVHDRATWHNFSGGPTRQTDNPLDVSIDGDAFFVVQTPRGERYTRNGSFQLNAAGELVTNSGDRVLGDAGPIQFQPTDNNISINRDGSITVREGANTALDSARGKLRLVRFDQVQSLLKDSSSMFRAPDEAAPLPADANTRVVQGTVEQSNVRPIVEMSRMIELTRTYSQIATLLQQHSDQRRGAIEKLAEVPA